MRTTFIFFIISIICNQSFAQTSIASVPDSLMNGMNEIVLKDKTVFSINSLTDSKLTRNYKVVILNKRATNRNEITLWYDNFRKIKNAQIILSDKEGEKIESYNIKDFEDYSTKGSSLASTGRVKYLDITHKQYPYILEVSYTVSYFHSYYFPDWCPQEVEKQSIINATFEVHSSQKETIRHKSINIEPDSIINNDVGIHYYWSVENLAGYKYETYSNWLDLKPVVFTAPNEFEFDGYKGNMSTWKDFGKWQLELNKGRNTLTEEQLEPVREIVSEATNKIDSIRKVYDYVQNNTRYVSIQLGIGGWQPFETGYVHEKQYGDCKALSFYTQSLLESIGIPAYYTIIGAGRSHHKVIPDFPKDYFNHIILTVPNKEDTIWLECTSQTNAFGNLGTFTGNRYALMVKKDGGHLIKTKNYSLKDNVQSTSAKIFLEPNGKGIAQVKRKYQGMEIENDGFIWTVLEGESKQQEWFIDEHDWGSMHLKSLEINNPSDEPVPAGGFKAEVEFERLAKPSGDRLFYSPFIFTNSNYIKLPKIERTTPIHLSYPYTEIDTIELVLPTAYYPEKTMADQNIESKFGTYSRSIIKKDDQFIFIRKFERNSGSYPASDYEDFRNFYRKTRKYDKEKIVLINKT